MFRPNVAGIVYRKNDGRYLLVHKPRKQHSWQFPQGGVEPGERDEQALLRELKEELGTDTFHNIHKSHHVFFYTFADGLLRDEKYKGQKQCYFMLEYLGTDEAIKLDNQELDDFRWVYQTELPEYLESPEYLQKVNQVIDELRHFYSNPSATPVSL